MGFFFWLFIGAVVFNAIGLVIMRREARRHPHPQLFMRMWIDVAIGSVLFFAALAREDTVLFWVLLVPVGFFELRAFRTARRLTRMQDQEALERWRAQGSPPPQRFPGESY